SRASARGSEPAGRWRSKPIPSGRTFQTVRRSKSCDSWRAPYLLIVTLVVFRLTISSATVRQIRGQDFRCFFGNVHENRLRACNQAALAMVFPWVFGDSWGREQVLSANMD